MKKLALIYLALFFIFPACVVSKKEAGINAGSPSIEKTAGAIRMLTAGDFPALPKEIVAYLDKRKCGIPQPPPLEKVLSNDAPEFYEFQRTRKDEPAILYNVISGNFFEKGRTDWATLCSENGVSSILVFKDGAVENIYEISRAPDDSFLQDLKGDGKQVFSRIIYPVSLDSGYVIRVDENKDRLTPRGVGGIEDAFIEKASVIWYHKNGRWRDAPGSD